MSTETPPGGMVQTQVTRRPIRAEDGRKWPRCRLCTKWQCGNVAMLLLVHVLSNVPAIVCGTEVTLPVWQCYSTKWQCYSPIRAAALPLGLQTSCYPRNAFF